MSTSPVASPVPSSPWSVPAARKEAHAFRGSVLNSYGRFELAVTTLLEAARLHSTYAALAAKPPHLLSQKLDLLAKLAHAEGPWKAGLAPVSAQLQAIRPYDEVRNLLSHGTLKVARTEDDETLYLFTMLRPGSTGLVSIQRAFTATESQELSRHINQLANKATQALARIADKHPIPVKILPVPTS